jgi:hypothetical protein
MELIIEQILGVSYDATTHTVTVCPNLPKGFENELLEIKELPITDCVYLDVQIDKGEIFCTCSDESVKIIL